MINIEHDAYHTYQEKIGSLEAELGKELDELRIFKEGQRVKCLKLKSISLNNEVSDMELTYSMFDRIMTISFAIIELLKLFNKKSSAEKGKG